MLTVNSFASCVVDPAPPKGINLCRALTPPCDCRLRTVRLQRCKAKTMIADTGALILLLSRKRSRTSTGEYMELANEECDGGG